MSGPYFSVPLKNVPNSILLGDENAFFHGINKSGSGAISDVLYDAFEQEKKLDRFFSRYHRCPPTSQELLALIARAEPKKGALYIDHYLYGAEETKRAPGAFITVFRHPMPRIVSCHSWLQRKHDSYPTLEEFVANSEGKSHAQICQFGVGFGPDRKNVMNRLSAREIFERAVENVETQVRCFGIAEHFEQSIFLFAHQFGLSRVMPWKRDKRNAARPLVDQLAPSTVSLIEEVYHYDLEFYALVLKKFKAWAAQIDFGPSFAAYQEACSAEYKDRILM